MNPTFWDSNSASKRGNVPRPKPNSIPLSFKGKKYKEQKKYLITDFRGLTIHELTKDECVVFFGRDWSYISSHYLNKTSRFQGLYHIKSIK